MLNSLIFSAIKESLSDDNDINTSISSDITRENTIETEAHAQAVATDSNVIDKHALSVANDNVISQEKLKQTAEETAVIDTNIASKEGQNIVEAENIVSDSAQVGSNIAVTASEVGNTVETNINSDAKAENTVENIKNGASSDAIVAGKTKEDIAYQKNTKNVITNTNTLKSSIAKIGTFFATNPEVAVLAGIAMAIGVAIVAYNKFNKTIEETAQLSEKALSTLNDSLDTINSNNQTIKGLSDEYKLLSNGVNNLGENVSLTESQFERYHEIVNKIADISPELVSGWDNEGNAIVRLKNNVDDLTHSYENAKIEAYNNFLNGNDEASAENVLQNVQNKINGMDMASNTKDSMGYNKQLEFLDVLEKQANKGIDALKTYYSNTVDFGYYTDLLKESTGLEDGDLKDLSDKDLQTVLKKIKLYRLSIQTEINSMVTDTESVADAYLNLFLLTNDDYDKLDENVTTALSVIVNSMDEELANSFNGNKEEVGLYVQSLLDAVTTDENSKEVSEAFTSLFTLNTDELSPNEAMQQINQYIDIIAQAIGEDPIELKVRLGFDSNQQLANNYNQVATDTINKFSPNASVIGQAEFREQSQQVKSDVNAFMKENSINTQDELAFWEQCKDESDTLQQAEEAYLNSHQHGSAIEFSPASFSGVVDNLSSIQSLYKSFQDDVENGITFTCDYSDIEGLRSQLVESDEQAGLTTEQFDEFEKIITSSTSTQAEIQQAYNDTATAYIYQSDCLVGLNADTRDTIVSQLELQGITNASEIVTQELADAYGELNDAGYDLKDELDAESASFLFESDMAEEAKIALLDYNISKITANGTTLDNVEDINALIEEIAYLGGATSALKEYANAKSGNFSGLGSGNYVPVGYGDEGDALDEIKETIENAKVQAHVNTSPKSSSSSSGSKSEKDTWLEEYKSKLGQLQDQLDMELINETQFYNQSEALMNTYLKDSSEHIEKYTDEISDAEKTLHSNWISSFEKEREALDNAHDDERISTKDYYEQLSALAEKYYSSANVNIAGTNVAITSQNQLDQVQDLIDKYKEAVTAREALYSGSKMSGNVDLYNRPIRLSDDNSEYNTILGETYNYSDFDIDKSGAFNVTPILPDGTAIDNLEDYIWEQLDNGTALEDMSIFMGGDYSSIDEAVNSAIDLHNEQEEIYSTEGEILTEIANKLGITGDEANDLILKIEKTANQTGQSIIQVYGQFTNEYQAVQREIAQGQQELLSSVGSAVNSIISSQISDLQDEAEKEEKKIQKKIDALDDQIESLNDKKDAIQDQIDAINDEADAENRLLTLMQAQADLAKAQNQKTKKTLIDGQYTYSVDYDAIADAQSAVSDAEQEIEIAKLEDQISDIEDAIDKLEEEQDELQELIDKSNEYYDNQIEKLEEYQKKWQDTIDAFTEAQNRALLMSVFGDTAVTDVLSQDTDILGDFTNQYLAMSSLMTENDGQFSQLALEMASLLGLDLSTVVGQFDNTTDSILNMNSALTGSTGATTGTQAKNDTGTNATNTTTTPNTKTNTGSSSSATESLTQVGDTSVAESTKVETFDTSIQTTTTDVGLLGEAVKALDGVEAKMKVTIKATLSGNGASYLGSGHYQGSANFNRKLDNLSNKTNSIALANGTAFAGGNIGLTKDEKQTLVGELGAEILVRGSQYQLIGGNGAEFKNLKKGDIIFNHKQSMELFKNGKLNGRGKMVGGAKAEGTVSGKAFANGLGVESTASDDIPDTWKNFINNMSKNVNRIPDILNNISTQLASNGNVNNVTTSHNNDNGDTYQFNITMPNITDKTSADKLLSDLNNMVTKRVQFFNKK